VNKFSTGEAVKFGWNTTKANFFFFLRIFVIVGIVYLVSGLISQGANKQDQVTRTLIGIVMWIIQMIVGMGMVKIALKFADGGKGEFADLYNQYPLFFKYLLASILTGVIVLIGFILLIVPGIIFSVRLKFVSYLIIDKGLGPIEAIKTSWNITKGSVWNLFVLGAALLGINILGALALLVGLLWTAPTTSIAEAYVYRKLSKTS